MSVNYPAIQKAIDTQNAIDVPVDVTGFGSMLSASDIDVQTALDTLDDHAHNQISRQEISATQTVSVTDLTVHHVIVLTYPLITLTLTYATGSHVTVVNRSGGDCYIGNTVLGDSAPVTIYNLESFEMIGNATDLDLV